MGNLTTVIQAGLHNPDCAFYTGAFIGQWMAIKWVIIILITLGVAKALDKLAWNPFLTWAKKKIYGDRFSMKRRKR